MKLIEVRPNAWVNPDRVLAVYLKKSADKYMFLFDFGDKEESENSKLFRSEEEAREWLSEVTSNIV